MKKLFYLATISGFVIGCSGESDSIPTSEKVNETKIMQAETDSIDVEDPEHPGEFKRVPKSEVQ